MQLEVESSESATLKSWEFDYVGNADHLLYEHMQHCWKYKGANARYTSIIQSSGMGKSRTVDQLSKKHLVVPLNLRLSSTGFPPADGDVRKWFLESETRLHAFARACAFLCALFEVLLRYLQRIKSDPGGLAANFRHLMTSGQTFSSQGSQRIKFYEEVLNLAREVTEDAKGGMTGHRLQMAVKKLMEYLIGDINSFQNCPLSLIISFDEAHTLAEVQYDNMDGSWSILSEVRRALQVFKYYPCFSLFLSTNGKIDQDITLENPQNRPFVELGFDQLAKQVISGETTLEDVASEEFMVSLGRPLFATRYIKGCEDIRRMTIAFAGQKLFCKPFSPSNDFIYDLTREEKMACISIRMPLEFRLRTPHARDMQRTLVERHMRVCLRADAGFENVVTATPSEPLLAEAAYLVMRSHVFNLQYILKSELQYGGLLDIDNRGELIAMALCLQARDAAATRLMCRVTPVIEFIQELLVSSAHDSVLHSKPAMTRKKKDDKTLQDTFRNSNIFFNHFVRFRKQELINRKYLWRLIIRGAAAICGDLRCGVDVVIPFLYRDAILKRENVSAILVQSDNSSDAEPKRNLFEIMNPFHLGLFDDGETTSIPVIRMVFALASTKASVVVPKHSRRTLLASEGGSEAEIYTAFDIWCAKVSHETFRPIKDKYEASIFNGLQLDEFTRVYGTKASKDAENAMRSMVPGADVHPAHWDWIPESEKKKRRQRRT